MEALYFDRFGSADMLHYGDLPDPEVGPGSVLVAPAAAGLNFADIYRRQGTYWIDGDAPWIGGYEGAGRILAVGSGVRDWSVGQRVGFADVARAQANRVSAPADRLIALPDEVDDTTAAALLLQGLTAQYLIEDSVRVGEGDTVLVHAAAGGVGRLITMMATARGAAVHALASTAEKRAAAVANGAVAAYDPRDDWVSQVREATEGGTGIVYDSVGSTLAQSLAALKPTGRVVFFGKAGGAPAPIDPLALMDSSKGVVGGDLWSYLVSVETHTIVGQLGREAARDGVVPSGTGAFLFVPNRGGARLRMYREGRPAPAAPLDAAPGMGAIYSAWLDSVVFVACAPRRQLLSYDLDNLCPARPLDLAGVPGQGGVTPDSGTLFVPLSAPPGLAVIDAQSRRVVATLAMPSTPLAALVPGGWGLCH